MSVKFLANERPFREDDIVFPFLMKSLHLLICDIRGFFDSTCSQHLTHLRLPTLRSG